MTMPAPLPEARTPATILDRAMASAGRRPVYATLDEFLAMTPDEQRRVTHLDLIMACDRWKYRGGRQWMLPERTVRSECDEAEEYHGEKQEADVR